MTTANHWPTIPHRIVAWLNVALHGASLQVDERVMGDR